MCSNMLRSSEDEFIFSVSIGTYDRIEIYLSITVDISRTNIMPLYALSLLFGVSPDMTQSLVWIYKRPDPLNELHMIHS